MVRLGRRWPATPRLYGSPRPAFDAIGGGVGSAGGSSKSFSHTIASDATAAVLFINPLTTTVGPTYTATLGGVSMTQVDSASYLSASGFFGYLVAFVLLNPPTGTQTVAFSQSSGTFNVAYGNSLSYKRVAGVGSKSDTGGTNSPATQSAPSQPLIVQAFTGTASPGGFTRTDGSTSRINVSTVGGQYYAMSVAEGQGSFGATWTPQGSPFNTFAGVAVPLNAILP